MSDGCDHKFVDGTRCLKCGVHVDTLRLARVLNDMFTPSIAQVMAAQERISLGDAARLTADDWATISWALGAAHGLLEYKRTVIDAAAARAKKPGAPS